MRINHSLSLFTATCLIITATFESCEQEASELAWPEITRETKPWTRWWWMGSSVNRDDLTAAMEEYQKAGLGGVEITPIYGVKGYEEQFIQFLSPDWVDMLLFTLTEAERLDLGVDMATGTGWPFGGPWVSADDACKNIVCKTYTLNGGETLDKPVDHLQEPMVRAIGRRIDISELVEPISENTDLQALALEQVRFGKPLPLVVLMSYSDKGDILDLTDLVNDDGVLNWTAPPGKWTLYALFQGWHGKMVERAAPGGEGDVIDHFSVTALEHYLDTFDRTFKDKDIHSLRAFFNDSYEVDDARGQADWTPDLLNEFNRRRGYDLREYLPALFGKDTEERNMRILYDYRLTISELLLENFTIPWRDWAAGKDAIVRNQSHGSPANILDLYAAVDIPETEGTDLPGIKLASSAAHITGKKLTSSESATWLNEHFLASLAEVKADIDNFFLGGVNHIFYHGTTFSPQAETWPGWMFYASVHFGPTNSFWNDFPALNSYVTRCQSFLQTGKPDNDVLLFYPFHDLISEPGSELLQHFSSGSPRSGDSGYRQNALFLLERGYSFDYISDRQVEQLDFMGGMLKTGWATYQSFILPQCEFIPAETFRELVDLAKKGAKIIVHKSLPADVPGFGSLEKNQEELNNLKALLDFMPVEGTGVSQAEVGEGTFLLGDDLEELLSFAGVIRESMVDRGLHFIRRINENGSLYFIVNRGGDTINGWIPLNHKGESAGLFNPASGIYGLTVLKPVQDDVIEVYLQLMPGESCILQMYYRPVKGPQYPFLEAAGNRIEIPGPWKISFISGGPVLPDEVSVNIPIAWTDLEGEAFRKFSGTARYSVTFPGPEGNAEVWLLDMGRIAESASVRLNGKDLATLFGPHYYVRIPAEELEEKNLLEIDVSNLMANRIADLDRQTSEWKKFYNINFPARFPENRGEDGLFTAKEWTPKPSGLIGPVTITPMKIMDFDSAGQR